MTTSPANLDYFSIYILKVYRMKEKVAPKRGGVPFPDFPDFQPNLTPPQMFRIGIMGGCYFRSITSPHTGITYKGRHKKYKFLEKIDKKLYLQKEYNKEINKYGVVVGTTYEYWMEKKWIREDVDPYGWIEWYCNFWYGRRSQDDLRQIRRWKRIASKTTGRFRKQLQRKINEIGSNDHSVYIGLRQTLLHWGFDTSCMVPEK